MVVKELGCLVRILSARWCSPIWHKASAVVFQSVGWRFGDNMLSFHLCNDCYLEDSLAEL